MNRLIGGWAASGRARPPRPRTKASTATGPSPASRSPVPAGPATQRGRYRQDLRGGRAAGLRVEQRDCMSCQGARHTTRAEQVVPARRKSIRCVAEWREIPPPGQGPATERTTSPVAPSIRAGLLVRRAPAWSCHHGPVDADGLPSHVGREVAREEERHVGDVLGLPIRPTPIARALWRTRGRRPRRVKSVSMNPGAIALTRIPPGASSFAADFVMPMTAALEPP